MMVTPIGHNQQKKSYYSGFLDKSGTVSWGRSHITTDCRFINEYTRVLIRSIFCGSYARSRCNLDVHSRAVQMILFVYLHMNLCALAYEPQLVASGSYRNYICAVLMQETTVLASVHYADVNKNGSLL